MGYIPTIYFVFTIAASCFLLNALLNNEKLSKTIKVMLGVFLGVIVVIMVPVSTYLGGLTMTGVMDSYSFYHGSSRDVFISSSAIVQGFADESSVAYRLQSVDLKTGKVLVRLVSFSPEIFLMQSGDLMWFYNRDDGLKLRAPDTLKVVADTKSLIDKNPEMENGISREYFALDPATDNLVVFLKNGKYFEVDVKTLAAKPLNQGAIRNMRVISSDNEDTESFKNQAITLKNREVFSLEGMPRSAIKRKTGRGFTPLSPKDNLSFLSASFLGDSVTGKPMELDSPDSVPVLYKESTDDETAHTIARISLDGTRIWEKSIFDPSTSRFIKAVRFFNNAIIIITNKEIFALNPADGSVKWTDIL